jgi:geranylgeranyl diphosphate synthase, type I
MPPRANPFLSLVATVQRSTEPRMKRVLAQRLKEARRLGPEVEALLTALRELVLRGGKRLRPAFVAAGLLAANERARLEPAVELGVALEFLHTYLLIHDDWMDGDALRRGGPTVHKLLGRALRSEALGEKSAILAGDYAMGLSLELLATGAARHPAQAALLSAFARMHNDAIFGQELDVAGKQPDPEQVYALKTASYTVRGPLVIGALVGGGQRALLRVIDRFSLPAGIAFQLQDDLIGAFGQPEVTGKPRGADLSAGKHTLLVKLGLELTRGADRKHLRAVLGKTRAGSREIERALAALENSGARAAVERRIAELVAQARRALSAPGLTPRGKTLLEGAVVALAERPS